MQQAGRAGLCPEGSGRQLAPEWDRGGDRGAPGGCPVVLGTCCRGMGGLCWQRVPGDGGGKGGRTVPCCSVPCRGPRGAHLMMGPSCSRCMSRTRGRSRLRSRCTKMRVSCTRTEGQSMKKTVSASQKRSSEWL